MSDTGKYEAVEGRCKGCSSSDIWLDMTNDTIVCSECRHTEPYGKFKQGK